MTGGMGAGAPGGVASCAPGYMTPCYRRVQKPRLPSRRFGGAAAQNYAGAYPSRATSSAVHAYDPNGRLIGRSVYRGNSTFTYSGIDGQYHSVKRGNVVYTYDNSGRLLRTGFKRGNAFYNYDRNGRLTSRGDLNSGRLYNPHGRYLGTVTR